MTVKTRSLFLTAVFLTPFIFLACGDSSSGGGGDFSVDGYAALTNESPYTFSGQKPAGHAVQVDGNELVAADSETTWTLALNLAEGSNSLIFSAMDGAGELFKSETVQITLDSTAPTIMGRVPAENQTDVALNLSVSVTLSEAIDCSTVTASTFSVQGVSATIECTGADTVLILTPQTNLDPNTTYTVSLLSDISDPAGNGLASDVGWQFTTGSTADNTPPDPPTADSPAPPQATVLDLVTVGGWKEAGSTVISNGTQIVAADDLDTWSHQFTLAMGDNSFSLTSQDAAGNVSTSSTDFTMVRTAGEFTLDVHPSATNQAPYTFSGTRSADYAVWVNGSEEQPAGAQTTWSYQAALSEGSNSFSFEARDGAGSTVATLNADITLDSQNPQIVSRTPSPNAQDVSLNSTVTVEFSEALDCASVDDSTFSIQSLSATVSCTPGNPIISLTPLTPLVESTAHTVTVGGSIADLAGNTLGADDSWDFTTQAVPAQLVVEFQLTDQWDTIGDEMYYRAVDRPAGPELNHFAVEIWVEGPYLDSESCTFNNTTRQREDTRYVGTVIHGTSNYCDPPTAIIPCAGNWDYTNFRTPNYLAALIEHGQWTNPTFTPTGESHPIPSDVIRRDPASGEQWPAGAAGANQAAHPELHFPWQTSWGEWLTHNKAVQEPYVDGMTEVTIDSGQDAINGQLMGNWTSDRSYTWDLTDAAGAGVNQGKYLLNIALNLDRARKSLGDTHLHYAHFQQSDRETCWDDPAHDDMGPHRAEGMIEIGGPSKQVIYLKEKGLPEYVDACAISNTHQFYGDGLITCDCQGSNIWPCPQTPVDPARIGEQVLFMAGDKFANPNGDGQDYAVRITYCPAGTPCP